LEGESVEGLTPPAKRAGRTRGCGSCPPPSAYRSSLQGRSTLRSHHPISGGSA